jgi:hypothetical protein
MAERVAKENGSRTSVMTLPYPDRNVVVQLHSEGVDNVWDDVGLLNFSKFSASGRESFEKFNEIWRMILGVWIPSVHRKLNAGRWMDAER